MKQQYFLQWQCGTTHKHINLYSKQGEAVQHCSKGQQQDALQVELT